MPLYSVGGLGKAWNVAIKWQIARLMQLFTEKLNEANS